MGNEQSHLTGLEIEQTAVEVADFWSQHSACMSNSDNLTNLTVFIGELFVDGSLWKSRTPLEKNSKNLMIYRHPCILKYISSWQKNSKYFLAVEEVMPLGHVLGTHSTLQICIGLHSILKSLCFLHEKAAVSHNNVCTASIYVSKDGNWKLGGMEYLCRYTDLSADYLKKSKLHRYNKAIDSNEENNINGQRKDIIDIYSYGVLVCEVLKGKSDSEIPGLSAFRDLAKNDFQNINVALRPKFKDLLTHEFFNHEFITIQSFLVELPLKTDEEKTIFFQNLLERLKVFPEVTVASQLGSLLLSRMVLLNKTAQDEVLPAILSPRQENEECSNKLFTENVFKKYLSPKLLEIFCVRDAQIRLLLLNYFSHFIQTFTKEELQSCILPELLVGIKDTNDHLVAVTLRTLADLVPILGSSTVIGGKRAKLFNDGRPIMHLEKKTRKDLKKTIPDSIIESNTNLVQIPLELPERPRPDGEEGETSTEEVEASVEEDLDNWDDWDINEANIQQINIEASDNNSSENVDLNVDVEIVPSLETQVTVPERPIENAATQKRVLPDILELDIKNQTNSDLNDDIDFFQDMEPIIETSSKFLITDKNDKNSESVGFKLSLNIVDDSNEDGWGDDDWE